MSKPCLLHPEIGDTNSPDQICRVCRVFEPEKVEEYLKNNTVPEGAKPENTKKSTSYGFNWQDKPLTKTRKAAIERHRKHINLDFVDARTGAHLELYRKETSKFRSKKQYEKTRKLHGAEERIADTLDEIGETEIILKGLEGK